MEIKAYKKDFDYSYTLGAFPTFELIDAKPGAVIKVYMASNFTDAEKLTDVCRRAGITLEVSDKTISRLSDKENVYVVGIFKKFDAQLDPKRAHLVLDRPSNMGNLGTIIRTSCGFGIYDIAIIGNGADEFNPKTVRASMGSLFRVRISRIESFDDYLKEYGSPQRNIYPFMLDGKEALSPDIKHSEVYSLVFGNEAAGLDPSYAERGVAVKIPQTEFVDSLNLTIAVGIGEYIFTSKMP